MTLHTTESRFVDFIIDYHKYKIDCKELMHTVSRIYEYVTKSNSIKVNRYHTKAMNILRGNYDIAKEYYGHFIWIILLLVQSSYSKTLTLK